MTTKKLDIVTWLKNWFEVVNNKVTSWSATTTNDHYPSEKLVKDSLDNKLDKTHSSYKGKNVVTNASTGTIEFEDKPTIPTKTSDLTNDADGTSGATYVLSTDSRLTDNRTPTAHATTATTYGLGSTTKYGHVKTINELTQASHSDGTALSAYQGKVLKDSIDTLSSQIATAGAVTLTKEQTANTGYFATYTFSQSGSSIGQIDIPKDFLVKSGSVKSVTTANNPVNGYVVGDKYIDLVINTKDSSGTDEHLYIKVSDLVEDTTYSADESTLTAYVASGANKFKVKDGGITSTQLNSTLKSNIVDVSSIELGPTTGTDAGCIIFHSIS